MTVMMRPCHCLRGMISFNMDMKKGVCYCEPDIAGLTSSEEYDAELERMNTAMTAENLALQHDNKQLNTLIKEYETTLETIMSLFRQRAVSITLSPCHLISFPALLSCGRCQILALLC